MGVSTVKSLSCEDYNGIKNVVNDANKQIRNFNLKTIAKIIALVAFFTLGGAFSVFACLKMGLASQIAGLAASPFGFCAGLFSVNILKSNVINKYQFVKNINEDVMTKLNKYQRSIRDAFEIVKTDYSNEEYVIDKYSTFVPKIPFNSHDRVNKKYEKDIRRHLPRFFQTSVQEPKGVLLGALLAAGSIYFLGTRLHNLLYTPIFSDHSAGRI